MAFTRSQALLVSLGIWALGCATIAYALGIPGSGSLSGCAGRRLTPRDPQDCSAEGAPVTLSLTMRRANRSHFALSGSMQVRAAVASAGSGPLELGLEGALCPGSSSAGPSGVCRRLVSLDLGDLCDRLGKSDAMGAAFFDHIMQRQDDGSLANMKRSCPVDEGEYVIEKYVASEEKLCDMLTITGLWTITFTAKSKGEVVACLLCTVDVYESF